MRVRVGGEWKEVSSARVYVSGAWKQVKNIRAYDSSTWRDVATFVAPMSASASPSSTTAARPGAGTATSETITVTPTGGQSPYTYSWVRVGGTSGNANSPASASTTFSRYLTEGESNSETFRCTVTDFFGTTATATVFVSFVSIFGDLS